MENSFYITLTPTANSNGDASVFSSFKTRLSSQIILSHKRKWYVSLVNAFIPINIETVDDERNQWVQYIWNKLSSSPFQEKYYFNNTVYNFINVFNQNTTIGFHQSLCKTHIPLKLNIYQNKIYIEINDNIKPNTYIGFKIHSRIYEKYFNNVLFDAYTSNKFTTRSTTPATISILKNTDGNISLYLKGYIAKGTCFLSTTNLKENSQQQIIDIECDVVESDKLAGIKGKIIACIVDDKNDLQSATDEKMKDVLIPVEINQFAEIQCNLYKHNTKHKLVYKYDLTLGIPFIILKLHAL